MRKYVLLIILIFSFLFCVPVSVFASSTYGFDTVEISEDEIARVWPKFNFRKSEDEVTLENIGLPIESFDVAENGRLLLGFKGNKIAIVDENNILNLFEFKTEGVFYVQWNGDNFLLYIVRGSIILELSQDGQLINYIETDTTSFQNVQLWNQACNRHKIDLGQYSYELQNKNWLENFGKVAYSQLIRSDANGNSVILYDAGSQHHIFSAAIRIIIVLIVIGGVAYIFVPFIIFEIGKRRMNKTGICKMRTF